MIFCLCKKLIISSEYWEIIRQDETNLTMNWFYRPAIHISQLKATPATETKSLIFCLRCLSVFTFDLVSLMNKSSCVEKYVIFWFCDKLASDNIGFLVSIYPHRQPCYHLASFNIRLLDFVNRDSKPDRNTSLGQKWFASDVDPKHKSLPIQWVSFGKKLEISTTGF